MKKYYYCIENESLYEGNWLNDEMDGNSPLNMNMKNILTILKKENLMVKVV